MLRIDPKSGKQKWYRTDGAKSVFSALISILIGMLVGAVLIVIVGLTKAEISCGGIWDGIRLVFLGILSTGRNGSGLSFGFNPVNLGNMLFRATPLIMTGMSVAVAFKTGLFNIGAPGQYLMGTAGTLSVGLALGNAGCPVMLAWLAAFLTGITAWPPRFHPHLRSSRCSMVYTRQSKLYKAFQQFRPLGVKQGNQW